MILHATAGEAVLIGASFAALLATVLHCMPGRRRAAGAVALLSLPALYLAAERGSQFTTADEHRILSETLNWARGSDAREWNLGAFRTSTAILTPVAQIIRTWPAHWQPEERLALLKNLHWMCGFAAFLGLLMAIHSAFQLRHGLASWLVCVYGLLLFPVHLMALKIVNYDELALQLSVLSLFLLIIAWRDDRAGYGLLAVALAYFGAQEKLSASPFLLLAMSVSTCLAWRRRRWLQGAVAPLLVCGAAGTLTTLVALATRSFDSSGFRAAWLDSIDPLISWVWVLHRFLLGQRDVMAYRWIDLVITEAVVLGAAGLLRALPSARRAAAIGGKARFRAAALLALLLIMLSVGMYGTFAVVGYWHPYFPLQPGQYDPGGEINRVTLHFAADSGWGHLLRAGAFHCAVFYNVLPTALLGLAFWVLGWRLRTADAAGFGRADVLLLAALLVPLAYAVIRMPFGHRYMNFALLVWAAVVIASWLRIVDDRTTRWKNTVGLLFSAAITLEVLPFAPAYFAFRAIWSPHAYPDALVPEVGRLNPTWLGWGEETMLGGELLSRWVREGRVPAAPPPTLYVAYYAAWLNPSSNVMVKPLGKNIRAIRYEADEYFLVNRSAYVQNARTFPRDVQPEAVIDFRGYVQAWIFRGDRLKAAGFQF